MEREDRKYELSLCMPIYNRLESFKYTFDNLVEQLKELKSEEIEIVISLNPSDDVFEETKEYLYKKRKEYDFLININETNVGSSNNITRAISLAHGRMVWVVGDDDLILNGCVSRVMGILKKYPDVNWIYLAYARLNGFPNDKDALVTEVNNYQLTGGYHSDGKDTAVKVHKKIGGKMLFSSSNIFLKSRYEEIEKETEEVGPQLSAAFASASQGAVYLDNEVGVLAGGCVSWNDIADYSATTRYFKDMYGAIGHGYNQQEINRMISYYMWHDGLHVWFRIYKLCLKGNEYGRESFMFFYRIMPVQTIMTMLLSPCIAVYLCLRHQLKNMRRRKSCLDYLKSENPDDLIIARIKAQ